MFQTQIDSQRLKVEIFRMTIHYWIYSKSNALGASMQPYAHSGFLASSDFHSLEHNVCPTPVSAKDELSVYLYLSPQYEQRSRVGVERRIM